MGGIVTIGLLMMAFGPRSKCIWESEGALGSGCRCLEESPGLEVLYLLGGALRTNGSGGGDVGGLHVAYLRWRGLDGAPPSNEGMVWGTGAWEESRGGKALGLWSREPEGSVWPPLMRTMAGMKWEVSFVSRGSLEFRKVVERFRKA